MSGVGNGTLPKKSAARRAQGMKAKRAGQLFEAMLELPAMRENIGVIKIPSSARWIGRRVIPIKSPFDFVMIREGVAVFFDAKSTAGKRFTASLVKLHQIMHLDKAARSGARAGYVVFFSELDRVVFYDTKQLSKLIRGTSLTPDEGLNLGSSLTLSLLPLFF